MVYKTKVLAFVACYPAVRRNFFGLVKDPENEFGIGSGKVACNADYRGCIYDLI